MLMRRCVFVLLVSITVSACLGGGGGGSGSGENSGDRGTTAPTMPITTDISVRGRVIDGYVTGATIFYDLNFNGILDDNEPNAISIEDGDFEIPVPEDIQPCISYAPLVVDVPVGAVDADQGEVEEAYQMSFPPQMVELDLNELVNITPLTSVLWNEIGLELFDEKPEVWLSCEDFINNQTKIAEVASLIASTLADVVQNLNLTEDEIYNDFIAAEQSQIAQQAASLVSSLAKGLSETLNLREQNPDAWYVKVLFKQGDTLDNDGAYPNAWYKKTSIFADDISFVRTDKMSDDLETVTKTILYGEITTYLKDDATIIESFEFESRNGDNTPYSCDSKELYFFENNGNEYEIVNLVSKPANVFEDCAVEDFDDEAGSRYIFVNGTQHTFSSRPYSALNDWFDYLDNYNTLDQEDARSYADSLSGTQ